MSNLVASKLERAVREARGAATVVDGPRASARLAMRLLPDFTFPGVRAQLLRIAGCDVRRGVALLGDLELIGPRGSAKNLRIGPNVTIGPGVVLGLDARITISRGVSIGPRAVLHTGTHALGPETCRMSPTAVGQPIFVDEGAWIGLGAMILPGVRIGRGAVISAGAVVTKDVAPNTLVAGNPACVVSELPTEPASIELSVGAR
jgi:acetyltransferase-like isoleucine patch superfamily enzyme